MNLCMTELRGLGSNLFANPQGMVTTELVKRTNVDFVAANVPAKRPAIATNQIQTQKVVHEPRQSPLSSTSINNAASSNSSSNQLARTLSDPKRAQDKLKQKQTMQQVNFFVHARNIRTLSNHILFDSAGNIPAPDLLVHSSGLLTFRQCSNCSNSSFVEISKT